jgi:hypothetical protein
MADIRVTKALAALLDKWNDKTNGVFVGNVVAVVGNTCNVQPIDVEAPMYQGVLLNLDTGGIAIKPVVGSLVICQLIGNADAKVVMYSQIMSADIQIPQIDVTSPQIEINKGVNGGVPISLAISAADNIQIAAINLTIAKVSALAAALLADPVIFGQILDPTKSALGAIAAAVIPVTPTVPIQYENPLIKH